MAPGPHTSSEPSSERGRKVCAGVGRSRRLAAIPPGLVESFLEPAAVLDSEHQILQDNEAYRDRFNTGGRGCGQRCHQVSHRLPVPCMQAGEDCPLAIAMKTGQPAESIHLHGILQKESLERVSVYPIRGSEGKIETFLQIFSPSNVNSPDREDGVHLIGHSESFLRVLNLVSRVAATSTTVLVYGESGTGKELVARALHRLSARSSRQFVAVECSGLTETLFESELFGHEKGAFTGAHSRKKGLVEVADGGTLFLDEIGDIPLSLQVKLLRLLETRSFRRVGSVHQLSSDFRLVCATHRNLKKLVDEGAFRSDLFYRISAFPVFLPPLRERPEDLEPLARSIFARLKCEKRCALDTDAVKILRAYTFPGNIRELRNMLERACLLADDGMIRADHLEGTGDSRPDRFRDLPFALDPRDVLPIDELERRYVQWLGNRFPGNRSELAQNLGISERSLYRKLREQ